VPLPTEWRLARMTLDLPRAKLACLSDSFSRNRERVAQQRAGNLYQTGERPIELQEITDRADSILVRFDRRIQRWSWPFSIASIGPL
jgi:hypothetical protein